MLGLKLIHVSKRDPMKSQQKQLFFNPQVMYMYGIDYKMYGYIREVLRPQHALEDLIETVNSQYRTY